MELQKFLRYGFTKKFEIWNYKKVWAMDLQKSLRYNYKKFELWDLQQVWDMELQKSLRYGLTKKFEI